MTADERSHELQAAVLTLSLQGLWARQGGSSHLCPHLCSYRAEHLFAHVKARRQSCCTGTAWQDQSHFALPPLPLSLSGCALQLVNSTVPVCLGCWESDHIQVNEQGARTLGCRCQDRYESPKPKLFSLLSGREPDNSAGEGGLNWYPVGCMLE